ncbi:MAG: hypothetical protein ACOCW8_03505 [bacterium]
MQRRKFIQSANMAGFGTGSSTRKPDTNTIFLNQTATGHLLQTGNSFTGASPNTGKKVLKR